MHYAAANASRESVRAEALLDEWKPEGPVILAVIKDWIPTIPRWSRGGKPL